MAIRLIRFRKRLIAQSPYEACAAFDVNNDGVVDLVSGEFWYEGPDFTRRHKLCDIKQVNEYYDDFSDYPLGCRRRRLDGHRDRQLVGTAAVAEKSRGLLSASGIHSRLMIAAIWKPSGFTTLMDVDDQKCSPTLRAERLDATN